jgi:hypothetical protein
VRVLRFPRLDHALILSLSHKKRKNSTFVGISVAES